MDGQRFDDLTRKLAGSSSRRSLLKGLAGIAGGGLLTRLGLDEAAAVRRGKRVPALRTCDDQTCPTGCCHRGVCLDPPPFPYCGVGGVDCERCGRGEVCLQGECRKPCAAGSCNTGCCNAGGCQPGTANDACGTGGAACTVCPPGTRCDGGRCVCDSDSCPFGCCDEAGVCQPGSHDDACGTLGQPCVRCRGREQCLNQVCRDPRCNAVSCPDGCCNSIARGVCEPGIDDFQCGTGGQLCSICLTGQRCVNKRCVCDEQSCPEGCCKDGFCEPGDTSAACGTNGQTCAVCDETEICLFGVCQPRCCEDGFGGQSGNLKAVPGALESTCVPCADGTRCVDGRCVEECAGEECGERCDADSCPNGCCDASGECQPGSFNDACGTGGKACEVCDAPRFCVAQRCEECNSFNCSVGCCRPDGGGCNDRGPFDDAACGKDGETCVPCGEGQECVDGRCVKECGFSNCRDGCCQPDGTCNLDGPIDDAACGTNGEICQVCLTSEGERCVGGVCVKPCGPANCGGCCRSDGSCLEDPPSPICGTGGQECQVCRSGTRCNNGRCLCDTDSGCVGCCEDGACNRRGLFDNAACGKDGTQCRQCAPDQSCRDGQCVTTCSNCDGCCKDGSCKRGSSSKACGTGGQACVTCDEGQECVGGRCVKRCDGETCPAGCCDANGECQRGDDPGACGRGGEACTVCPDGQVCPLGECQEPCGSLNCTGCCDENGVCRPGNNPSACGFLGLRCEVCEAGLLCVDGVCRCGPDGPCATGCCDPSTGTCEPGTDNLACGTDGQTCTACAEGTRCVDGRCVCDEQSCPQGCCGNVCNPCPACQTCNQSEGTCGPDPERNGTPCDAMGEWGMCCNGTCIPATDCCTAADCPEPANPCQGERTCTAGRCGFSPAAAGTVCRPTAGDCDLAEVCDGESTECPVDEVKPAGTVCREAADACEVAEVCDGESAACPPDLRKSDNEPCGDGRICCGGECVDRMTDPEHCGTCGARCTVEDVCRRAVCVEGECGSEPDTAKDGTACDDGDRCTNEDVCRDGVCTGTPVVCEPSSVCRDAACDPASGKCVETPKPNGTTCGDNNACTDAETCQEGVCTPGTVVVCQPLNVCHEAGVCDPATGQCSNPRKDDGTPCGTGGEVCRAGECVCPEGQSCGEGATATCCRERETCIDAECKPCLGRGDRCGQFDEIETCCPGLICAVDGISGDRTCQPCSTAGGRCDAIGSSCCAELECCGFACIAPCPTCQTCDPQAGSCKPDPEQDGFACGDGGKCCNGACIPISDCCTADECPLPIAPCQGERTCIAGTCGFSPAEAGTLCRLAIGPCDLEEVCDGKSTECPPDRFADADVICRSAQGECDFPAFCTGQSAICPPNAPVDDNTGCGDGQICCGGLCVANTTTTTCGSCGNSCDGNQTCQNGQCVAAACRTLAESCANTDECCDGLTCSDIGDGILGCCSACGQGGCCRLVNPVEFCIEGDCCPADQTCVNRQSVPVACCGPFERCDRDLGACVPD